MANMLIRDMARISGIIGLVVFLAGVFPFSVQAAEDSWLYMGKTDDDKSLLYMDSKNMVYLNDNLVRVRIKKELTIKGVEEYRKEFDESVKRAEKEAGTPVQDKDALFKSLANSNVKFFVYEVNCIENIITIIPAGPSPISFYFAIKPNSADENLKKTACGKHEKRQ